MRKQGTIFLLIGTILMLGMMFIMQGSSILPLNGEELGLVTVRACPQDTKEYSFSYPEAMQKLADTVNSLTLEETESRPDESADSYYFLDIAYANSGFLLEFDCSHICLTPGGGHGETYAGDTSALLAVMDEVIPAVISGEIE